MADLLHLPEEFPMSALTVLAPIVRSGGAVDDKVEAAEAVITLEAWAIGQWLGHDHAADAQRAPSARPESHKTPIPTSVAQSSAEKAVSTLEGMSTPAAEGAQAAPLDMRKLMESAFKIVQFVIPLILAA